MGSRPIFIGWGVLLAALTAITWLGYTSSLNADVLFVQAFLGDLWGVSAPFRWTVPPANGLFPGVLIGALGFFAGFDNATFYLYYAAAYSVLLFAGAGIMLRAQWGWSPRRHGRRRRWRCC